MAEFSEIRNCYRGSSIVFLLLPLQFLRAMGCNSFSGPVVPTTPLVIFLESVQATALNTFGKSDFDPKFYVDLSLKFDLEKTKSAFRSLPKSSNGSVPVENLKGFIEEYFHGPGEDLVYAEPVDFVPEPKGFLPGVENLEVRGWALELHSLWKNLSRKISERVVRQPELHTLLPLPELIVVPGSRFREVYYWDSYWIIRGLLASRMHETAKRIAMNLVSLVEEYGFVPNGARAYYTNRSQPPLLSSMVYEIFSRTRDADFVRKVLPSLLREHKFWTSGVHKVIIQDAQGCNHTMSCYYAMWDKPRPESSTIDKEVASKLPYESEKLCLYRELASTAESGWDFSSRWMEDPSDLTTLATTSILPVDLNIFLLKMEHDISFLAKAIGDVSTSNQLYTAYQSRKASINLIFWSEKKGQWLDYWLKSSSKEGVHTWDMRNQNENIFASNFVPLWIESFSSDPSLLVKVMESLRRSGLIGEAGIATSLTDSGQQWDYPNGWAPLQHMIVEGLARSGSKEARSMAKDIAVWWIRSNYIAYKKTGAMHEKYDVRECGKFGGGGEYVPQTGFGWTNGVVLAFLEEFGWPKDLHIDC